MGLSPIGDGREKEVVAHRILKYNQRTFKS
jgi:hypothetical protein